MEWLKKILRRKMRPIPRYKARYYKDRLTVVYYMLAWTLGGFTMLQFIFSDKQVLSDDLNIYADPNERKKPDIYKYAQHIRRDNNDKEMRIINVTNFSVKSIESFKVKELEEINANTLQRGEDDFFGGIEESFEEEEQNVTM